MSYSVKEMFYTLQGEGTHAGRPAVFCRFAGCNLWSGREADRATAVCRFCDTDFVGTDGLGGGKFEHAEALAVRIASFWPDTGAGRKGQRFVVLTGGEPLLQVDADLIDALHAEGFLIAVETNGTIAAPAGLDWVCVSPKAGSTVVQTSGHELKVVVPQAGFSEADLQAMSSWQFGQRRVQAMDSADAAARQHAAAWAVQWCLDHPDWLLSVQTHKSLGIR
ncbi:7-carboxy-7-deazaguanine synthase (Cx14CxxC type) [Aquabacterium commune]|uniref:7-carboxy-7-deazaguanine synthase n=1 Tax=Aquabacterium commune TaxID=70586 RepID=A0A4R6RHZ6_9BURK|nr:7-carboxy-7-deazaguanine synthase [Aquabacterium commune]TDP86033.1 7-carboxy-7-deazaguanine synthase (Cx14CxxC type) [Aquabacterium commune]